MKEFNQQVEKFSFSGWVQFDKNSVGCVGFGGDTLEEALKDAEENMEYYRQQNRHPRIEKLYALCKSCGGTGYVEGKRTVYRRGRKRKAMKQCPVCKGINSSQTIFELK